MTQRIYVGNLPFSATEGEVAELFGQYGEIVSCSLPKDRETGRPRGFGFVEMDDEDAKKAISALDGKDMGGPSRGPWAASKKPPRRTAQTTQRPPPP